MLSASKGISGQADPEYLNAKLHDIKSLNCAAPKCWRISRKYIGSAALSFIVGLYRISEGRVVLVRAQPRVLEVLDITHLSTVIPWLKISGQIWPRYEASLPQPHRSRV